MHISHCQIWHCVTSTMTGVIDLAKDQFCKTTVFFAKINHTAVRPRVYHCPMDSTVHVDGSVIDTYITANSSGQ